MRLYFRDLPSYQNLTEAQKLHPLYSPNLSFNLDRLPAALRNDFAAFIFDRQKPFPTSPCAQKPSSSILWQTL